MNTEFPRTTWARATREHDDEFRCALVAEIITAIAKASMVTDANIMAIRTGETLEALINCMISFARISTLRATYANLPKASPSAFAARSRRRALEASAKISSSAHRKEGRHE